MNLPFCLPAWRLRGPAEQSLRQRADFRLAGTAGQSLFDFLLQHLALKRLALVGMRRPAWLAVPGAGAAIDQLLFRAVPRPRFHQAVQPQVEVEATLVAMHIADLLLACPPHFLDILERLLF